MNKRQGFKQEPPGSYSYAKSFKGHWHLRADIYVGENDFLLQAMNGVLIVEIRWS